MITQKQILSLMSEILVFVLGNLVFLNVFSVDIEGKKQKEKLKVVENRSPHVLISRFTTEVSSGPPSTSSETRSAFLASHLNPPQVCALHPFSFF
jgi:hypothetical protein